jgi:hypothetical protein
MGLVSVGSMQVSAVSKARDKDKPQCVMALDPTGPQTFKVSGGGTVNVPNCGIHVNSGNNNALFQSGSGSIKAKSITVVGGATAGNYTPAPKTNQKVVADPLIAVAEPTVPGACTYKKETFNANVTLSGGSVYCEAITFNANVTFGPGIHYFKDAQVKTGASITMTSQNARLYFSSNSDWDSSGAGKIAFEPMTTGTYAGIAMFGSRSDTKAPAFKLTGNKDYSVNGTVYLPKQGMELHGGISLNVTAKSGYVIAYQFTYSGEGNFNFEAFGGVVPTGWVLATPVFVQ